MIKCERTSEYIDCHFEGNPESVFIEYNSVTVGMIKYCRKTGCTDEEIKKLLIDNVDMAYNVLNDKAHIKEIHDGK